jgi:ABC-type nitrate/sulfonate/bicarbonate transport system substrate-binding protein
MHPGKILLALTFAALHCLLLHLAASAQPIPLRYAQAPSAMRSIFSLPVAVAERQGFFRREGLDFEIVVPIPGGSDRMIDALHDDTADMTHVATAFLIRAAQTKSDAAAIIAEFNNPIYSLIAKPEIKSFAALKGKLLGLADEAGSIRCPCASCLPSMDSSRVISASRPSRGPLRVSTA